MENELATNPVAEAPTLDAPATEVADTPQEEIESEVPPVEDDSEEIEHEGQKYRVPKAVKPLLMFNADYTRKTQEVSEQRKTLETERATFGEQVKAQQEYIREAGRLDLMDEQLAQYGKVNWQAFWEQDPVKAGAASSNFQALQHARQQLGDRLRQKDAERASQAERDNASRYEKAVAAFQTAVPNWSPGSDIDQKMGKFSAEHGLAPSDVVGAIANNPKLAKILHLAFVGSQLIDKQRAAAKPPAPPEAKPVPQVNARAAPNTGLHDGLTTEEWTKRRNAQVKAAGR